MWGNRLPRERKRGRGAGKPGGMDETGERDFLAGAVANLPCSTVDWVGHSRPRLW